MAGSTTARGAAADSAAENAPGDAEVTVSSSGVDVVHDDAAAFEPTEVYSFDGKETRTAATREELFALKFDGYLTRKPAGADEKSKTGKKS